MNNTHQQPSTKEIEEAVNDFFAITKSHPGIDKKKQLTGVIQSLLTSHLEAIREKVISKRVIPEHSSECLIVEFPEHCDCDNYVKYNQALDDILALLNEK